MGREKHVICYTFIKYVNMHRTDAVSHAQLRLGVGSSMKLPEKEQFSIVSSIPDLARKNKRAVGHVASLLTRLLKLGDPAFRTQDAVLWKRVEDATDVLFGREDELYYM